uniref:Uncharacterized protein n=1 Tax=Glossina morsitans morsitans TaxID=37546 RepID=A0ABK9MIA9_GLOMM
MYMLVILLYQIICRKKKIRNKKSSPALKQNKKKNLVYLLHTPSPVVTLTLFTRTNPEKHLTLNLVHFNILNVSALHKIKARECR